MPQLLHYLQVDSQTTLGTISTSKDVFQNFTYQVSYKLYFLMINNYLFIIGY